MDSLTKLTENNRENLLRLEEKLGYPFRDPRLLQLALLHRSFSYEQVRRLATDNERLEFLGDAVLDLVVGRALFELYPEMREGEMTRLRALLVNESYLAEMAGALGLGEFLLLGRGEETTQGRAKPSILSSAYEAVLGALFQDGGFEIAAAFIDQQFLPVLESQRHRLVQADAKSRLQEILQEEFSEAPSYVLDSAEGPDHRKTFMVSVCFRGLVLAQGQAFSKKEAEQAAAAEALQRLPELGLIPS
ncbi:MAG: ribonuclease III [Desulfobulbaceae bacterium]|nr:ribonuclease III [Desulfobulbaceae bacterium]